jgi:DNA-binding CsgD family transcriptional regulator
MVQVPEYFSNILAKIQHLQDLYSKHYKLSLSLYDQDGAKFLVASNYSLFCGQTCAKGEDFCQDFFSKLLQQVKKQSSSLLVACPFGLSTAIVPLGLCLETNAALPADYYLIVGKIKLSDGEGIFSAKSPPADLQGEMSRKEFKEIAQLIAFNMDMIFSLIKLGGISPHKKKTIKKEDYAQLTQREKEILHLVSIGMSNQEIAGALFISDHTVKVHISNILKKLRLNNRTKLAVYKIQALD